MNWKKSLVVLFFVGAGALFFWLDLKSYLTLEALKANRQALLGFYASHRVAMIAGFMLVYIVQTALSLPGATILSMAAGAVFGSLMGTVYASISATIGATLALLAVRYLLRDAVSNRFGPRLDKINLELESRGLSYLLFLRLIPLFPFFLINIAAGLTRMPLRTFFIGTLLGIIPGGFVYVNAGASLATINSLSDVVSSRVLGSLALLGLFAFIPVLYSRFKNSKGVQSLI